MKKYLSLHTPSHISTHAGLRTAAGRVARSGNDLGDAGVDLGGTRDDLGGTRDNLGGTRDDWAARRMI